MSYATFETSQQNGSPVELVDLVLGDQSWHWCSGEETVTIDGTTYTPLALNRDAVPLLDQSSEETQPIAINVPGDSEFVLLYANVVPSTPATVAIRRYHRTDADKNLIFMFKGQVDSVSWSNNGANAAINVMNVTTRISLPIGRYTYSSLCNNVLGDSFCQIDLSTGADSDGHAFTHTGTCTSVVSGTPFEIIVGGLTGYPDHFFDSGVLTDSSGDPRMIVSQIGDHVRLSSALFAGSDVVSTTVTMTAGCDHSFNVCGEKFSNAINFAGFPFVPRNNPFSTGLPSGGKISS
jgi:uncharacterized phage protein (TIGR02218 family)